MLNARWRLRMVHVFDVDARIDAFEVLNARWRLRMVHGKADRETVQFEGAQRQMASEDGSLICQDEQGRSIMCSTPDGV